MTLLVTDVTVGDRPGRAVQVVDGRIAWMGDAAQAPSADRTIAGEGALLTPAFVDAHVHATATGLALTGLDLHPSLSLAEAVASVADHVGAGDGIVLGTGWDETPWPERRGLTRHDLDAVVGDRPAYLARVDVHSATVSTALLDRIPGITGMPGYDADGQLRLDAHHAARRAAYGAVAPDQRRAAQRATLDAAAALGIGCLHEMAGPEVSGAEDLAGLLELAAGAGPRVIGYWGELAERGGLDVVRELDLAGAGGDLFCDGAFGSHTAALSRPYSDRPDTSGALRFETGQLVDHVRRCTEAGIQAGFHCIGDAAVSAAVTGLERVAKLLGVEAVRDARHRLEHVEMVTPAQIEVLARLGVAGSLQPAFDAAWGGPGELYEQRLGRDRAWRLNPLRTWHRAGGVVAYGTDAPVTPLAGWAMVADAVRHRQPDQRVSARAALAAASRGGHLAAGEVDAGLLAPGKRAHLAIWDADPTTLDATGLPDLAAGAPLPECAALLVDGRVVLDRVDQQLSSGPYRC
jgi:predicted amidohydrolase YtcJ